MYTYTINKTTNDVTIEWDGVSVDIPLNELSDEIKKARELIATYEAIVSELEKPAESQAKEETVAIRGVEFFQVDNLRAIKSPYNAEFVKELKATIPSAKWNGSKRVWVFAAIDENKVYEIAMKFFGGATKRVRITVEYNSARSGYTAPMIDGSAIIDMSRDSWKWNTATTQKHSVSVIEENLTSGGSRKYPQLSGTIIFEATIREGAIIEAGHAQLTIDNI